jgi:hypothetical protein
MYCPSCEKEIGDKSRFCMYCGCKIEPSTSSGFIQYEHYDFDVDAEKGKHFGSISVFANLVNEQVMAEENARLHFWSKNKDELGEIFQGLRDEGWEPITEIGPGCLKIFKLERKKKSGPSDTFFGHFTPQWQLVGFYVKFRRPKIT